MIIKVKEQYRKDWRKVNMKRHPTHVTLIWYHWSKRPRLAICYYDERMSEQRHAKFRFNIDWNQR